MCIKVPIWKCHCIKKNKKQIWSVYENCSLQPSIDMNQSLSDMPPNDEANTEPRSQNIDGFEIPTPFRYHPIWPRCDLGVLQDLLWSILYIKCTNPNYPIEYAHCFVMWLWCALCSHIHLARPFTQRQNLTAYTDTHTHIYIYTNKYLLLPWHCDKYSSMA